MRRSVRLAKLFKSPFLGKKRVGHLINSYLNNRKQMILKDCKDLYFLARFSFKEENKCSTAPKKSQISALPGQTYPRLTKIKFLLLVLDHLSTAHFIVQYKT